MSNELDTIAEFTFFTDLPEDVICNILDKLTGWDLLSFGQTSKQSNGLMKRHFKTTTLIDFGYPLKVTGGCPIEQGIKRTILEHCGEKLLTIKVKNVECIFDDEDFSRVFGAARTFSSPVKLDGLDDAIYVERRYWRYGEPRQVGWPPGAPLTTRITELFKNSTRKGRLYKRIGLKAMVDSDPCTMDALLSTIIGAKEPEPKFPEWGDFYNAIRSVATNRGELLIDFGIGLIIGHFTAFEAITTNCKRLKALRFAVCGTDGEDLAKKNIRSTLTKSHSIDEAIIHYYHVSKNLQSAEIKWIGRRIFHYLNGKLVG